MSKLKARWWQLLLLAAAIVYPLVVPNDYYISIMTLGFIWALATMGLNLITGYTGQLNLAHGGFFAIGAYTHALLTVDAGWPFWVAFVVAGLLTALIGFLVGIVALRLKEHYFAIFTLCVGFIIYLVIEKWEWLTHGVVGVFGIEAAPAVGPVDFYNELPQYYMVLFFLVVGMWLMSRVVKSLLGRTFVAIRNSDDLAEALGINLMKNKVLAFVLSTFIAGIAGALYSGYVKFLGPDIANIVHTFDIITFLLVGGIGTLFGPIVGALLVTVLTQYLQFLEDYRMIVFGPLLVLLVIFFPQGLVGSFLSWRGRRKAKAAAQGVPARSSGSERGTSKEANSNA